ncbi:uncharacterized protein LOC134945412 [Pseudophryne corroboree]|uniref:uncharacterized protein LOC134945412 n=1 Tax=Pseudophryne corroboree TaxID=495146 RepID=UPI0030812298
MEKQTMQKKNKMPTYGQGTMLTILMVLTCQATAEVDITQNSGIYTFWYNSSNTEVATYKIDFCNFGPCLRKHYEWGCDQYGTRNTPNEAYICVTSKYWGNKCAYWGSVGWNSGHSYGYQPKEALSSKDKYGESLLTRLTLYRQNRCDSKFILSIRHPQSTDAGTYVLGESFFINPSLTQFLLQDMFNNEKYAQLKSPKPRPNLLRPHITTFQLMIAIDNPTFEGTMAIETGFSDINLWVEWMRYNAKKHNMTNCYVCGKSRPHLGTVPLNIPLDQESCFFSLYNDTETNEGSPTSNTAPTHRRKRETPVGSFDPHVYIDTIWVPRGVPDEFKARDEVAAGFESLIPIITVNKNVAWINYIYYNQQRFVNDTKDALKGLSEQLEATSQMTFQNQMALDMILAKKVVLVFTLVR